MNHGSRHHTTTSIVPHPRLRGVEALANLLFKKATYLKLEKIPMKMLHMVDCCHPPWRIPRWNKLRSADVMSRYYHSSPDVSEFPPDPRSQHACHRISPQAASRAAHAKNN